MAKCPYLNSVNLCDIYSDRPQCCRNYPNRSHPNCKDAIRCEGICSSCKDICCNNILLTHGTIIESLNIHCDNCKQTWNGE